MKKKKKNVFVSLWIIGILIDLVYYVFFYLNWSDSNPTHSSSFHYKILNVIFLFTHFQCMFV